LGLPGGVAPWTPTKNLFEKRFLELQKLSKRVIYQYFLKVLEKGSGEKLLSRSFSPGVLPFPYKLQFESLLLLQHLQHIGEGGEALLQNPVHMGDGYAVVDHGDTGLGGDLHAVRHFLFVEHATTAMDDELVVG
jgi:hypothetical protein